MIGDRTHPGHNEWVQSSPLENSWGRVFNFKVDILFMLSTEWKFSWWAIKVL